jgi:hypothetical protein
MEREPSPDGTESDDEPFLESGASAFEAESIPSELALAREIDTFLSPHPFFLFASLPRLIRCVTRRNS